VRVSEADYDDEDIEKETEKDREREREGEDTVGAKVEVVKEVKEKDFQLSNEAQRLHFLFHVYRPRFWYWEVNAHI